MWPFTVIIDYKYVIPLLVNTIGYDIVLNVSKVKYKLQIIRNNYFLLFVYVKWETALNPWIWRHYIFGMRVQLCQLNIMQDNYCNSNKSSYWGSHRKKKNSAIRHKVFIDYWKKWHKIRNIQYTDIYLCNINLFCSHLIDLKLKRRQLIRTAVNVWKIKVIQFIHIIYF